MHDLQAARLELGLTQATRGRIKCRVTQTQGEAHTDFSSATSLTTLHDMLKVFACDRLNSSNTCNLLLASAAALLQDASRARCCCNSASMLCASASFSAI